MKARIAPVLILAAAVSACAGTLQTASISEAYKKYDRGRYKKTLELITRAENAQEMYPEQKAEVTFLKALVYEQLGEPQVAMTLYRYIEEQHPDSQYAYRARQKLEAVR